MKILHFFKCYLPESFGGVENTIYQLVHGMYPKGVESTVMCLYGNALAQPILNFEDHTVVRSLNAINYASTPIGQRFFRRFQCLIEDVDLVHYHFPYPVADVFYLLNGRKKPSVVTYHSDIVRQKCLFLFYKPLMYSFLSKVDSIVATSPNYLESSPVLKRFKDKIQVIPLGIREESGDAVDPELVEKWRKRVGEGFFLFVGVFRYYKGLKYLLEAARVTNYEVVLAGSGPQEKEIIKTKEKYKLDHVHMLGRISEPDKLALLQLCRAVIFPSHLRSEAFGITLLEGARFGKPLISCEIGTGTSYVNKDMETGFVVPPRDPYALATAMHKIFHYPELSDKFSTSSRERFHENFTAQRMADSYLDLYTSILQKR